MMISKGREKGTKGNKIKAEPVNISRLYIVALSRQGFPGWCNSSHINNKACWFSVHMLVRYLLLEPGDREYDEIPRCVFWFVREPCGLLPRHTHSRIKLGMPYAEGVFASPHSHIGWFWATRWKWWEMTRNVRRKTGKTRRKCHPTTHVHIIGIHIVCCIDIYKRETGRIWIHNSYHWKHSWEVKRWSGFGSPKCETDGH